MFVSSYFGEKRKKGRGKDIKITCVCVSRCLREKRGKGKKGRVEGKKGRGRRRYIKMTCVYVSSCSREGDEKGKKGREQILKLPVLRVGGG